MHRDQKINKDTIQAINQGDIKAFETLYAAYYVFLGTVATKYVYQIEVAREITNDVFLNLWSNRATLDFPIHSYLICAVRNRCLNYIQRKRMSEFPLTDVQEQLLSFQEIQINQEELPLTQLEYKEMQEQIRQAVYSLPEKCRNIFIQYLYHNKTYDEIADLYSISNSTVRGQIRIAMAKLKVLLADLRIYAYLVLLINFEK
ncbi:RNA polymerase sigma-70 factor [Parabacteroides sp.]